jgi:ribonuclease P protein component
LRSIVLPAQPPSGTAMIIPSNPDAQRFQRTIPDNSRGAIAVHSLSGLRLQKHADYVRAYSASRKRQSASMSWFLAPRQPDGSEKLAAPRVGLTAGKVLGKAHERNRIKRRMREALRRHADLLPQGCDLIFHPRRSVLSIEFAKLEGEVVRILHQANAGAHQAFAEARQANSEAAKTITGGSPSSVSKAVRVKPRT